MYFWTRACASTVAHMQRERERGSFSPFFLHGHGRDVDEPFAAPPRRRLTAAAGGTPELGVLSSRRPCQGPADRGTAVNEIPAQLAPSASGQALFRWAGAGRSACKRTH